MADRVCKKCGKIFDGYHNALYCDTCNPWKSKAKRFFIEPGKTYGMVEVIGRSDRPYCRWICRCKKCGREFLGGATEIKASENGCGKCRMKKKQKIKNDELNKLVGKQYGNLKIVEIIGVLEKYKGSPQTFVRCECQLCGGLSEIPLSRLKQGGAEKCVKCSKSVLAPGRELGSEMHVGGTLISAIDGRRKLNKNSATGHSGVSQTKTRAHRAYINFRRKQYHLGLYSRIEDAIAARKEAEKNIFGNFLEWYADSYPEQWARINKNKLDK